MANFPPSEPGQFIQIQASDPRDDGDPVESDWSPGETFDSSRDFVEPTALLNRPFSIALREDEHAGVSLSIIYRTIGVGTAHLSQLIAGSFTSILGPLGRRFTPPDVGVTPLLVGGGVGIPPMIYSSQTWGRGRAIAFCGAMSRDLLALTITTEPDRAGTIPMCCAAEFSRFDVPIVITSDDGSIGRRGYVTDALVDWRKSHPDTPAKVYACGPEPMLQRVALIAAVYSTPCEVAVERAMACGLGTCQSCVIRVRDGQSWKYKLACTDGPVFDASTLLW